MLGIMADIDQQSVALIWNLSNVNSKLSCKVKLRKYWIRSLAPVKVYLGDVNFVEKGTPIVTLDFVVQRTVDLTLTT